MCLPFTSVVSVAGIAVKPESSAAVILAAPYLYVTVSLVSRSSCFASLRSYCIVTPGLNTSPTN